MAIKGGNKKRNPKKLISFSSPSPGAATPHPDQIFIFFSLTRLPPPLAKKKENQSHRDFPSASLHLTVFSLNRPLSPHTPISFSQQPTTTSEDQPLPLPPQTSHPKTRHRLTFPSPPAVALPLSQDRPSSPPHKPSHRSSPCPSFSHSSRRLASPHPPFWIFSLLPQPDSRSSRPSQISLTEPH